MRAYRTVGPDDAFQLGEGRFFVLEMRLVENAHDAFLVMPDYFIPLGLSTL